MIACQLVYLFSVLVKLAETNQEPAPKPVKKSAVGATRKPAAKKTSAASKKKATGVWMLLPFYRMVEFHCSYALKSFQKGCDAIEESF